MNIISTTEHYDNLIRIGNDPFHDNEEAKKYMDRWTGSDFISLLEVDESKIVLEIGVGSGRLAWRVLNLGCKHFTGIDLSKDTIQKTQSNLNRFSNTSLIANDFLTYDFNHKFDIIYSALTFMHIPDKKSALKKIIELLNPKGVIVISFFNVEEEYLDFGTYQVKLHPNNIEEILDTLKNFECEIELVDELFENQDLLATIIKVRK